MVVLFFGKNEIQTLVLSGLTKTFLNKNYWLFIGLMVFIAVIVVIACIKNLIRECVRRCSSAAKKTTKTETILGKPAVIAVVKPLPAPPPPLPSPIIIHSSLSSQPIEPEMYCELDGTVDPLLKLTLDECLEVLVPMKGMERNII